MFKYIYSIDGNPVYTALSTDAFPTNVLPGSFCYITDTNIKQRFSGDLWVDYKEVALVSEALGWVLELAGTTTNPAPAGDEILSFSNGRTWQNLVDDYSEIFIEVGLPSFRSNSVFRTLLPTVTLRDNTVIDITEMFINSTSYSVFISSSGNNNIGVSLADTSFKVVNNNANLNNFKIWGKKKQ
jgi:hypothetical protein